METRKKSNVVKLSVHKNTKEKHDRRAIKERLVEFSKTLADIDGFALIYFTNDPDGDQTVGAAYHVRDARDVYSLPDMARMELLRYICEMGRES